MAEREPVVLNGRYELHSRIARGGMAEVYLARDQLLDRPVAVKVLFPEFAADPAFVERFRREAQSAANLTHANIVGVFDWGSYKGTYFIVMEYVRGRSLADILRAEGTLHPDRAADITIDIAGALYFAHRNGVVHRDVKPANVLISPRGEVKVADFGIARAVGGNTDNLTQTGSVMGTATYFSPEQAQGLAVDPRSDLYALGVVLYEMVVGRPPFLGDSPVAIAYQHVQAQPTRPGDINAAVPPALEAVILKLLAKNPADRYASAEDLRADLRRFREGRPVAAIAEAGAAADVGAVAVGAGAAGATGVTTAMPRTTMMEGGPAAQRPAPGGPRYVDEPVYEPPRRNGLFIGVLVALLLALGVLLFMFARTVLGSPGGETSANTPVEVPNVVGEQLNVAEATLRKLGLKVETVFEPNDTQPENTVFAQKPPEGSTVDAGSTVQITVSSRAEPLDMPALVNRTEEAARDELRSAGFTKTPIIKRQPTEDKSKRGLVADQVPQAGKKVAKDAEITLYVYSAPQEIDLPQVAGLSFDQARQKLEQAGFQAEKIQRFDQPSNDVEAGKVIGTDPTGKASPDVVVQVVVSTGPERKIVPKVLNLFQADAETQLKNAGFNVEVKYTELNNGDSGIGKVVDQDPDGDSKLEPGKTVTIAVGVPKATTTSSSSTTSTTQNNNTTSSSSTSSSTTSTTSG